MDEIVLAALRKWPDVPHCFGWLALDARGQWWMRDDAAQRAGPFPQIKGSRVEHEALIGFIGRNYGVDHLGGWFFQNGPQRVYVDLEVTPWIYRLVDEPAGEPASTPGGVPLRTHTGRVAHAASASVDEHGRLFLHADLGLGLVHTQDMHRAADWIGEGRLGVTERRWDVLVREAGFSARPRPSAPGTPGPGAATP
jgi:hypothetical protein